MFAPESVSLLREVYNWTIADLNINDLDDQKYTLCRKLSEVRGSDMRRPWILTNVPSSPTA
jgi:exportin-5